MIFVVLAAVYLGSSDTENLKISNQERINKNAERNCKKKLSIAWEYLNCLADNGYKNCLLHNQTNFNFTRL